MPDEKRSQAVIDENMEKLPELFSVLDKSLAGKTYLNGRSFTLADLNVQSVASIAPMIGFDMSTYKNIDLWMKAISDRPAFQKYSNLRKG
jgi:glutathione S-transferase